MSTTVKVEKLQGKTKKCTICEEEKDLSLFVKRSNRTSGRQAYCKDCHNRRQKDKYSPKQMKEYNLIKLYGITIKDYDKIFYSQNGCCKICNTHISELNSNHKKTLCVDHCHTTDKIRGLLCDSCNRGLGLFKDSPEVLKKAIEYLNQ